MFILSSLTPLSIELESKYKKSVEKAIEYVRTIKNFNDLVDLRTPAFYCLGPEPSSFVLQNIEIEQKKSKC